MRGDVKNRFNQNLIGKLGELGAAKLIGGKIDMRIWETGSRGADQFEGDVVGARGLYRDYNIHVKTCHLRLRNMASWTVDANDPLMKGYENDIIILMMADEEGRVKGVGRVMARDVASLWKRCVSNHMQHKRAIYAEDIANYIQRL